MDVTDPPKKELKYTRPRKKAEMLRDRKQIAAMYLRGELQIDIAEELGLTPMMVSRDIKALHKEWLQSSILDYNTLKSNELAKIDHLEITYWGAWLESCEDAETIRQEGKALDKQLQPSKVVRTSKGQTGDPRYLSGVQWCINKRCEILGIDAPKQINYKSDVQITEVKGVMFPSDSIGNYDLSAPPDRTDPPTPEES
jgi:hypothetical protein